MYPSVHQFLSRMEVVITRARKFTKEEIQRALQLDRGTSSEWIMKRAAMSIAFCGGLSIAGVRNIKLGNVSVNQKGVVVTYPAGDEEGREIHDEFLVPFTPPDSAGSSPCLASIVIEYLDRLRSFQPDLDLDSPLFHKTLKDESYSKEAVGQHRLHELGKEVALLLGLDSPETYGTKCFIISGKAKGAPRANHS